MQKIYDSSTKKQKKNFQKGVRQALRPTGVSSEVFTVFTEIREDGILEKSDKALLQGRKQFEIEKDFLDRAKSNELV